MRTPYLLLLLLLTLVMVSGYTFHSLYHAQDEMITAYEKRYNAYLLATQLRRSSDELTRLVRTYAATQKPMYEEQFQEVLAIRNGTSPLPEHYDRVYWDFLAVPEGTAPFPLGDTVSMREQMQKMHFSDEDYALLATSQIHSDRLVELERKAINLVEATQPGQQEALQLLHGDTYHQAKIAIMQPINTFYEKLNLSTRQQVAHATDRLNTTLTLQVMTFIATIMLIALLMAYARRYHRHAIHQLNARVEERTEELSASNEELRKALKDIKTLRGIIPICSYCHSIREDEGSWEMLEAYISKHSEADFSHGVCPKCLPRARSDSGLPVEPPESQI